MHISRNHDNLLPTQVSWNIDFFLLSLKQWGRNIVNIISNWLRIGVFWVVYIQSYVKMHPMRVIMCVQLKGRSWLTAKSTPLCEPRNSNFEWHLANSDNQFIKETSRMRYNLHNVVTGIVNKANEGSSIVTWTKCRVNISVRTSRARDTYIDKFRI